MHWVHINKKKQKITQRKRKILLKLWLITPSILSFRCLANEKYQMINYDLYLKYILPSKMALPLQQMLMLNPQELQGMQEKQHQRNWYPIQQELQWNWEIMCSWQHKLKKCKAVRNLKLQCIFIWLPFSQFLELRRCLWDGVSDMNITYR